MQKKIKKWSLVSKRGSVLVFNEKPILDTFFINGKEFKSGYWYILETKKYYCSKYWKLYDCEIKLENENKRK